MVVNFIFEYVENSVQKCEDIFEKAKENAVTFYGDVVNGARRFLYSIFNIRKIELIKIKNSYNVKNNFVFITKNSDRVRYANLLAPPNIF